VSNDARSRGCAQPSCTIGDPVVRVTETAPNEKSSEMLTFPHEEVSSC
jgi:hypothetical protein